MTDGELHFYEDAELKHPIKTINWGRLPVGKKYEKTIYMANPDKEWPIVNITLNTNDEMLQVEYPQVLRPNGKAEIKLSMDVLFSQNKGLAVAQMFTGEMFIG